MADVEPGPKTWILRIKIHKTIIVVHAEPNTKLANLKDEVFAALNETHNTRSIVNGGGQYNIPDSSDELQLARLVDRNDPGSGWELLQDEGNSKGKAVAGSRSSSTLQSFSLYDGAVLALRFDTTPWDVVQPSSEVVDMEEEEDIKIPNIAR